MLRKTITTALAAASAALALLASPVTATAAPVSPSTSGMALGLAGPYDPSQVSTMKDAGVKLTVLELSWDRAEPREGVFDASYLSSMAWQAQVLKYFGFQVALNTGTMNAPQWLLDKPGARFVDQNGHTYTGAPLPNLVFAKQYRHYEEEYLAQMFRALGTDFFIVRAGGGYSGELSYPYEFGADGKVTNSYWAFDSGARAVDPVPGWRPGQPSPHGEATTFLTWYLNSLVDFQNWQIQAIRKGGYTGTVAMLYPSFGMRPGDFQAATAGNLSRTSSAEINGEVQRGYDFARQVAAITDPGVAVYSTWGEDPRVVPYLAGLAHAKGLQVMAENGSAQSAPVMQAAIQQAVQNGLSAFFLVRAPQFLCGCNGWATLPQIGGFRTAAVAAQQQH